MIDVTEMACPEAPDGGTHHMVPRRSGTGQVLVCRYCGRTEAELRAQA